MIAAHRLRLVAAAERYAAADRSDPFAFRRAIAHIDNGVASFTQGGQDAFYDAEPHQEERQLPDGRTYHITVYRSARRP